MAGGTDFGRSSSLSLVNALLRVSFLRDASSRTTVVQLIGEVLDEPFTVAEHAHPFQHVWNIVEACRRHPTGLDALVHVIGQVEGNSRQLREVGRIVGDMRTAELWPDAEYQRLLALLAGVSIPTMPDIYRHVTGDSGQPLPPGATLVEYLHAVDALNADSSGLPRLLALLEHLVPEVRADLSAELRAWADTQSERLGLVAELQSMRTRCAQRPQVRPEPQAAAYLVVLILPESPSGQRCRLAHWRQLDLTEGWKPLRGNDVVGDLDDIKLAVAELIEEVESEWSHFDPDVRIEFVLPNELLNLDVDQWPWDTTSIPQPIGTRFPVAVRALERMREDKYHRHWRQRWKRLSGWLEGAGPLPEEANHWAGGQNPDALGGVLMRDMSLLSMVLGEPPLPGSSGLDDVAVGVRDGIPLMLWHRNNCTSEEFRDLVKGVLHGEGEPMLERVRLARADARAERKPGHAGNALSVLWDDPDRVVTPTLVHPPKG